MAKNLKKTAAEIPSKHKIDEPEPIWDLVNEIKSGDAVLIRLTLTEKAALENFQKIHMIHGQPPPSAVAQMALRLALMTPDQLSANISSLFRYMRAEGIEDTAAVQFALLTDRIAATLPKRWKSKTK